MECKQLLLVASILNHIIVCNCREVQSSKISIRSTSSENDLTLICHVKYLFSRVEFLHNSNSFNAYCHPPYPTPLCSSDKSGVITQNLKTNCTVLVLTSEVSIYQGVWSCKHGSNGDKSNEVSILYKDNTCSNGIITVLLIILTIVFSICIVLFVIVLRYGRGWQGTQNEHEGSKNKEEIPKSGIPQKQKTNIGIDTSSAVEANRKLHKIMKHPNVILY